MPRYFSLEQAQRTIPRVESAVRSAIRLKSEFQEAEDAVRAFARKVMKSGGMMVDTERAGKLHQTRTETAERLKAALTEIEDVGCLVKDLDIGLLDFPTFYRGREVYLCWRLGESAIEFWHGVDEGFRGRKRIDDDFLANHTGEPVS